MFTIIVKISLPIIYLVKLKVTWPRDCLKSPDFPLKYLPTGVVWRDLYRNSVFGTLMAFPNDFFFMLMVSVFLMKKLILVKTISRRQQHSKS